MYKEALMLGLIVTLIQPDLSLFLFMFFTEPTNMLPVGSRCFFRLLFHPPNKSVRAQSLKVISVHVPHILIEKLLQNSCIHASSSVSFHSYMAIEPGNKQQKRV